MVSDKVLFLFFNFVWCKKMGKRREGGVGVVIAKIRFDIDWEVFVCSYQGWTKKGNKAV